MGSKKGGSCEFSSGSLRIKTGGGSSNVHQLGLLRSAAFSAPLSLASSVHQPLLLLAFPCSAFCSASYCCSPARRLHPCSYSPSAAARPSLLHFSAALLLRCPASLLQIKHATACLPLLRFTFKAARSGLELQPSCSAGILARLLLVPHCCSPLPQLGSAALPPQLSVLQTCGKETRLRRSAPNWAATRFALPLLGNLCSSLLCCCCSFTTLLLQSI